MRGIYGVKGKRAGSCREQIQYDRTAIMAQKALEYSLNAIGMIR